jgi:hypothetical protein
MKQLAGVAGFVLLLANSPRVVRTLITGATLFFSVTATQATVVLPGLFFDSQVSLNGTNSPPLSSVPGTISLGTPGADYSSVSISLGSAPSVSAVSTDPNPGTGLAGGVASASVLLDYYFEIFGPSSSNVPLIIVATGSTASSGGPGLLQAGGATAGFIIRAGSVVNSQGAIIYECLAAHPTQNFNLGCFGNPSAFQINGAFSFLPNTLYEVQLDAETGTAQPPSSANVDVTAASASIDPAIFIDPSFADAGLYTLAFSPGITAGSANSSVPEPASIALFLPGLIGLAIIWWRRSSPRIVRGI